MYVLASVCAAVRVLFLCAHVIVGVYERACVHQLVCARVLA